MTDLKASALISLIAFFVLALATGCDRFSGAEPPSTDTDEAGLEELSDSYVKSSGWPEEPPRILSLAPNITEILFELGLGDQVVAVTRYCDWPDAVHHLPRVGGVLDPDYEAILATEADLVLGVTHDAQRDLINKIAAADMDYAFLAIDDFPSIFAAIDHLGRWLGADQRAHQLAAEIDAQLQGGARRIAQRFDGQSLSVLLVFDREPVVAAGPGSFGDELIRAAGLTNALGHKPLGTYPVLDMEYILKTNPEIVIDLTFGPNAAAEAHLFWSRFDAIDAVAQDRLLHLDDPVMQRPGPRIAHAVDRLAEALETL